MGYYANSQSSSPACSASQLFADSSRLLEGILRRNGWTLSICLHFSYGRTMIVAFLIPRNQRDGAISRWCNDGRFTVIHTVRKGMIMIIVSEKSSLPLSSSKSLFSIFFYLSLLLSNNDSRRLEINCTAKPRSNSRFVKLLIVFFRWQTEKMISSPFKYITSANSPRQSLSVVACEGVFKRLLAI